MKKSLVIALALAFVLSIGATAFAAANPFVDVPAKHWAYDAVMKLANAGIVDGYGDKTFRGDRTMSRYEMAQVVAKAMAKSDKADAQMKALIDKLAVEFAAELNNLGVRVAKLEKNASSIKFSGDSRIRYQQNWGADTPNGLDADERWQQRIRVNMVADLNDKAMFVGRLVAQNRSDEMGKGSTGNVTYDIAKFVFKNVMPLSDWSIGRHEISIGQGLLSDTAGIDAVKFTFGKELKGWYMYGDISPLPNPPTGGEAAKNVSVLNLSYNLNKDWNMTGSYFKSHTASYYFDNWAVGVKGKFNEFTFIGEYTVNNHDYHDGNPNDNAYWMALWYKGANKAKVGSWGAYVDYRKVGYKVIDFDATTLNGTSDRKGFGYGFNYTFAKNAVFTATVENLKDLYGYKYEPLVYLQANFWF